MNKKKRWIPVTKKLPKLFQEVEVLVRIHKTFAFAEYGYLGRKGIWRILMEKGRPMEAPYEITHWRESEIPTQLASHKL